MAVVVDLTDREWEGVWGADLVVRLMVRVVQEFSVDIMVVEWEEVGGWAWVVDLMEWVVDRVEWVGLGGDELKAVSPVRISTTTRSYVSIVPSTISAISEGCGDDCSVNDPVPPMTPHSAG